METSGFLDRIFTNLVKLLKQFFKSFFLLFILFVFFPQLLCLSISALFLFFFAKESY